MTLLTLLMLLIYIVIGAATIITMRSRALDIARYAAGALFLVMLITFSLTLESADMFIVLLLSLCIVLSVEITAFKESKGDRKNLFLVHAFTLTMSLVLIIILITL